MEVPGRASGGAARRLVVHADLAKSDPAGEPLEEAVTLGEPFERRRCSRREQTEVAGIGRDPLPRAPVDQQIKRPHREPAQPGLALAVCLRGIDDVIAVIQPVPHQRLYQRRRMLAVTIHEQHGAEAGMIETGQQGGLLAEIA